MSQPDGETPGKRAPGEPGLRTALPYLIGFAAFGLSVSVLGPTLPGLAVRAGVPLSQLGLLFTARAVGGILGAVGGGAWVDRGGGTRAVAFSLAMAAVVTAVGPLVPSFALFLALWFAQGVAIGAVNAGSNALLLWSYPKERVAPYVNAAHLCFGLGSTLAPLLIVPLLGRADGLLLAYAAAGLVLLPGSALFWRAPAPCVPLRKAPPVGEGGPKGLPILLVGMFLLFTVGSEIAFGGWLFSYAQGIGLATAAVAAYLNAAMWGGYTVARLLSVPLAMRYAPQRVIALAMLGGTASLGLLSLLPRSSPALWVGTIGFGFFVALVFPNTFTLAGRHAALTGRRAALLFAFGGVGGMALPALLGELYGTVGPRATMPALLVAFALGGAVFVPMARRSGAGAAARRG